MSEIVKACGIVIFRREDELKFLMMRTGTFYEPGGKGKQEVGETDFETAVRETEEECGLTIKDLTFPFGQMYSFETEKYKKNKKFVRYYIAETKVKEIDIPINPEYGKREHDAYFWMNYDESYKVSGPRIQAVLTWAKNLIDGKNESTISSK